MLIWIIFIIALVLSTMLVNYAQQLFMKILGADVMYYRAKTKIIAIFVIALFMSSIIIQMFGINIPK